MIDRTCLHAVFTVSDPPCHSLLLLLSPPILHTPLLPRPLQPNSPRSKVWLTRSPSSCRLLCPHSDVNLPYWGRPAWRRGGGGQTEVFPPIVRRERKRERREEREVPCTGETGRERNSSSCFKQWHWASGMWCNLLTGYILFFLHLHFLVAGFKVYFGRNAHRGRNFAQ